MLLRQVYENARVVRSGKYQTTVNELTDQIPALRPRVLWEAALEVTKVGNFQAQKIVTEEDKGAPLATVVSLITGLSLAIARWYPYSLEDLAQIEVPIESEYFTGKLYLNGIEPGEKVIIIDDTLSTGGTIVSLVEAIRKAKADVAEIICLVEKVGFGGVEHVREATGLEVKTVIKIKIVEGKVEVLS